MVQRTITTGPQGHLLSWSDPDPDPNSAFPRDTENFHAFFRNEYFSKKKKSFFEDLLLLLWCIVAMKDIISKKLDIKYGLCKNTFEHRGRKCVQNSYLSACRPCRGNAARPITICAKLTGLMSDIWCLMTMSDVNLKCKYDSICR
jgi:hypothetical protein